jgi:hypothetical protein
MAKETYYFSHDFYARTDRKLVAIAMKHGMAGIGVFWCLVEMLYEEGGAMPLEYERISFELRTNVDVIKSVVNDFGLFETDDDLFFSKTVIDRLKLRQEKSEKARKSINKRWEKFEEGDTNV